MTMRFLCMHKASPRDEAGEMPDRELIEGMGQLIGEAAQRGILLAGEGLKPSSMRYRLTFAAGRCDVEKGPLRGDNELPQRLVIMKVGEPAAAIDWARRYGESVGAERLEVGPLTEEWDLTGSPRPADAPWRFMILHMADPAFEAGEPLSAERRQALRAVLAEMRDAGVLVFTEALLQSSAGARLNYKDNARVRTDGPFTESKELIGGFCMIQARSIDEIIVFSDRFARIIGGNVEIDVRVVADGDGANA